MKILGLRSNLDMSTNTLCAPINFCGEVASRWMGMRCSISFFVQLLYNNAVAGCKQKLKRVGKHSSYIISVKQMPDIWHLAAS